MPRDRDETKKLTVNLPMDIHLKARRLMAEVPGATMTDAVILLMRRGLDAPRATLKEELRRQLADKPTSED